MFKVNVGGSDLKKLVAALMPVVGNSPIAVLGMGWFRVVGGKVTATTTNMDQSITANCSCDGEGAALIHMKKLSAFMAVIPSGAMVLLSEKSGMINATCGDVKYSIATQDVADFPTAVAEPVEGRKEWEVDAQEVSHALSVLTPACEHGIGARDYLRGVWFQSSGRYIASDGKCLGRLPMKGEIPGFDFILPEVSATLCKPILSGNVVFHISAAGNALSITNESGASMRTKLYESRPPPFDEFLRHARTSWLTVDPDQMLSALTQGALAAIGEKPEFCRVGISISSGKIEFTSELGSEKSHGECDADYDGPAHSFGARYDLMRWAIQSLDADTLEFGWAADSAKHLRAKAGDPNNMRLVMERT